MRLMSVTLETFHDANGWLKEEASWNMRLMAVTLETSHCDMSPLKWVAPRNI